MGHQTTYRRLAADDMKPDSMAIYFGLDHSGSNWGWHILRLYLLSLCERYLSGQRLHRRFTLSTLDPSNSFLCSYLLCIATFVDFDERMIPDEVTVFGTLLALVLAAFIPESRLFDTAALLNGELYLHAYSPKSGLNGGMKRHFCTVWDCLDSGGLPVCRSSARYVMDLNEA